jgi:hypothetical protein
MGLAIPTILVTAYPDDVDRNRALTRLIARLHETPLFSRGELAGSISTLGKVN